MRRLETNDDERWRAMVEPLLPLDPDAVFPALPAPLRLSADPRFTGRGVTLAQIDGGFFPHPDLAGPPNRIRAWVDVAGARNRERRFGPDEAPRWPGWNARRAIDWHGTMTSAVAAGSGADSAGLYRGLASGSDLVIIRVADHRNRIGNASLTRALGWIARRGVEFGVRVVNFSVGGEPLDPGDGDRTAELVAALVRQGIVVVAAAGNRGLDRLVPPASAAGAVTVGGVDDRNSLDPSARTLWHGNYAEELAKPELTAPSVWLAAPMLPGTPVAAEAARLWALKASAAADGAGNNVRPRLDALKVVTAGYQHVDGTSFAAALVASVVCCMLEANPSLTPAGVIAHLAAACDPIPGVPSSRQGAGTLHAGRAVALALESGHATTRTRSA
jgi:serine protease AprX